MGVRQDVDEVVALDAQIVRLDGQARHADDVFASELARLKIDELLERRHELTEARHG